MLTNQKDDSSNSRRAKIASIILLGLVFFFLGLGFPTEKDSALAKTTQKQNIKAKKPVKQVKKAAPKRKGVGNGQCVAYARHASGLKHRGNAIEWKKFINSRIPKKGSVVVLNYGKLGHVAVVEAVSGGTITVSEQNYYGPYIINRRNISRNDPHILGYVAKTAQTA